jgi:hypothetical protein
MVMIFFTAFLRSQDGLNSSSYGIPVLEGYDPHMVPVVSQLTGFEQSPYKAMLLLLENAGYGMFDCYVPTLAEEPRLSESQLWEEADVPASCKPVWDLLESHCVTWADKQRLAKSNPNRMSNTIDIKYCATCDVYDIRDLEECSEALIEGGGLRDLNTIESGGLS